MKVTSVPKSRELKPTMGGARMFAVSCVVEQDGQSQAWSCLTDAPPDKLRAMLLDAYLTGGELSHEQLRCEAV